MRHVPIFVLVAVPVVAQSASEFRSLRSGSKTGSSANTLGPRLWLHFALAGASLLFVSVRIHQVIVEQQSAEIALYPARAVAFLKSHPSPPNLFGFYDWGGYLIWSLYPAQRIYIDGRADLYGNAILRQFADTYTLRHDWKHGLEEACTVLVPTGSALAAGLTHNPEWFNAYADEQATVFRRPGSPSSQGCTLDVYHSDLKFHPQGL